MPLGLNAFAEQIRKRIDLIKDHIESAHLATRYRILRSKRSLQQRKRAIRNRKTAFRQQLGNARIQTKHSIQTSVRNVTNRLRYIFLNNKHFLLLGTHGRSNRSFTINPVVFIVITCISIFTLLVSGRFVFPETHEHLIAKINYLQNERDKLLKQQARSDASEEIKTQHLIALEDSLKQQQKQNLMLSERISTFENILQARKSAGVQMVQARILSAEANTLEYDIALSKGGNYPRSLSGFIDFDIIDVQEQRTALTFEGDKRSLPYSIKTHLFLHGTISYPHSLDTIKHVEAIMYDKSMNEISRTKIFIKR